MAKKILVIDDDQATVKYLSALFSDNGYETIVAFDGVEALETARTNKPDLITLDLEMPEEWGPRFYRKLTKDKEYEDIPVIVVSGLAGKHAVAKAAAFVKKPFEADELMEIVKNTIGEAV